MFLLGLLFLFVYKNGYTFYDYDIMHYEQII